MKMRLDICIRNILFSTGNVLQYELRKLGLGESQDVFMAEASAAL